MTFLKAVHWSSVLEYLTMLGKRCAATSEKVSVRQWCWCCPATGTAEWHRALVEVTFLLFQVRCGDNWSQ